MPRPNLSTEAGTEAYARSTSWHTPRSDAAPTSIAHCRGVLGGSTAKPAGAYLSQSECTQTQTSPPQLTVFNTEQYADWHMWHYMCNYTGRTC
jgi:hypothetical protein